MAEEITTDVSVEVYVGDERPFVPADIKLEFELKKIEENYIPESLIIPLHVTPVGFDRPACIINIETTGISPTESIVFCIGVFDLRTPGNAPIMFINVDEETLIRNFTDWFEAQDFREIWGYNVNFDYRFLFSRMLRYRLSAPLFSACKQHDIMELMKKGTEDYVPTLNKPGTLNDWSIFLRGENPPATQEQLFTWWEEGNLDEIVNFNIYKIEAAYDLFLLWLKATGQLEQLPAFLEVAGAEETTGETKLVKCKKCMQLNEIPATATDYTCFICGTAQKA